MKFNRRALIGTVLVSAPVHELALLATSTTTWLSDLDGELVAVDPEGLNIRKIGVREPVSICQTIPDLILVQDADQHWWGLRDGAPYPVPAGVIAALEWRDRFVQPWLPHRWIVTRTADERGTTVTIRDRQGQIILEQSFPRRIELAASLVSPSRRWTIYFQGNNVASEVTVMDAATASIWMVKLQHNADLAPYAISIVLDPAETQAVISLTRASAPDPETWVLDLADQSVTLIERNIGFVLGWVSYAWGAGTGIIDLRP